MNIFFKIFSSFLLLCLSSIAIAQFDDDVSQKQADTEVESLYDRFDKEEEKKKPAKLPTKDIVNKEFKSLSDLANLEPFSDIAVIQRRFLPKTGRFDISGMAMGSVNNPFFSNLGLGLRGTYYFNEKHGLELKYYFLSNSERSVTANLREKRGVQTKSLTTPKNYMGAAYKWTPVYGKMTWLNQTIVPFDLFFTAGGGMTKTDLGNQEPTIHIGTGQLFALSKKMAIRWDISWNFYRAEAQEAGQTIENNQDDLFLMIGMSFFFPEAKYR